VTSLVTRGFAYRSSYAAAKAALESITRTMAIELAGEGITLQTASRLDAPKRNYSVRTMHQGKRAI
jgi:enoyl-[acyl-carrier-protein] reductase (NADH)